MRFNHFANNVTASHADFPVDDSQLNQDLYAAVNGKWEEQATIPGDHSSTGGFMDLVDGIEKTLMHDFADLLDGTSNPTTPKWASSRSSTP